MYKRQNIGFGRSFDYSTLRIRYVSYLVTPMVRVQFYCPSLEILLHTVCEALHRFCSTQSVPYYTDFAAHSLLNFPRILLHSVCYILHGFCCTLYATCSANFTVIHHRFHDTRVWLYTVGSVLHGFCYNIVCYTHSATWGLLQVTQLHTIVSRN